MPAWGAGGRMTGFGHDAVIGITILLAAGWHEDAIDIACRDCLCRVNFIPARALDFFDIAQCKLIERFAYGVDRVLSFIMIELGVSNLLN